MADEEWKESIKRQVEAKFSNNIEKINYMEGWKGRDYSELVTDWMSRRKLSYSRIKHFRVSPLEFVHRLETPFEQTPAMLKGSVVDAILTEKKNFNKLFFIAPEPISRRSNEGKAKYWMYQQIAGDAEVIDEDLFNECLHIANSVRQNPAARYYIDRKHMGQQWVEWKHPETGYQFIGKTDWTSDPKEPDFFIADLKCMSKADTESFQRDIFKMDYHIQESSYRKAFFYRGIFNVRFVWIVVESSEPYNVNVISPDKNMMAFADEELHNSLLAFKYCHENNLWHRSFDWLRDELVNYGTAYKPGWVKPKFG